MSKKEKNVEVEDDGAMSYEEMVGASNDSYDYEEKSRFEEEMELKDAYFYDAHAPDEEFLEEPHDQQLEEDEEELESELEADAPEPLVLGIDYPVSFDDHSNEKKEVNSESITIHEDEDLPF